MSKKEIYVSTDVETDGPIPGENSMLSFGSAAFIVGETDPVSTFTRNLNVLPGAVPNKSTMDWWNTQPEAWKAHRENLVDSKAAMEDYIQWLKDLENKYKGKVVFVGYPAGFDFMFVYWYLIKFCQYSPFSFSAIDIKTYAMAILNTPYRETTKRTMPREWFAKIKHNHIAIDDAIEQGMLFMNILKYRKKYMKLDNKVY